jgi:hypothetical protein
MEIPVNTYKKRCNCHKTCNFNPCTCNTYAPQRHNLFRINTYKKGGGGPTLWKRPTPHPPLATSPSSQGMI